MWRTWMGFCWKKRRFERVVWIYIIDMRCVMIRLIVRLYVYKGK